MARLRVYIDGLEYIVCNEVRVVIEDSRTSESAIRNPHDIRLENWFQDEEGKVKSGVSLFSNGYSNSMELIGNRDYVWSMVVTHLEPEDKE